MTTPTAPLAKDGAPSVPWRERLRLRLLAWLWGYRMRMATAWTLGIASLAGLAATAVLAALHFYRVNAASNVGFDRIEWFRAMAFLLAALVSVAGMGAAVLLMFRTQRQRVRETERDAEFARSIVEASPDAIVIVNGQGIIQSTNAITGALFGYSDAMALAGENISRLLPQRNLMHEAATHQPGRPFMAFGQRQNFLTFPVEVAVSEIPGEGQRLFVVLIHDASERRYSQEVVHHISMTVSSMTGEEFIRSLLVQLSQLLPSDFAFILERGNTSGEGPLLLAERGRLRGAERIAVAGSVFEGAFASGFAAYPSEVRTAYPHDATLQQLNAESFVATPLRDAAGSPVGLIGFISRTAMENTEVARQTLQIFATRAAAEVARKHETAELASEKERIHGDYTVMRDTAERERRRYEEDIAAEQEMLAVTLRSIREGCITTDNDGRIMTLNPVAEDLTGWTQPEAGDRFVDEVVSLHHRRTHKPIDPEVLLKNADQLTAPLTLRSRDGVDRVIEVSAAPIRNRQERELGTVYVFRDITEKLRLEEERQKAEKLESLGLAAGGIAHDFNNLLTAIIGNLSLGLAAAPEGTARERVEASRKASLRAQELAQQLLTFAKGGAPIKKTASMRQLMLDTVGFSLSGTNIRSDFNIPEDLWPVDIDAGQISQVISNLAVNAVQAMTQGGTLHVTGSNIQLPGDSHGLPPTLAPGRYVRITVLDEGPGIPEEIRKKIFDPYFTTKAKGSGLGLATSYSIVKNHDGLIEIESNPSEGGAKFILHLPASEAEIAPEPVVSKVVSSKKGKVLVLDDEEIICELVSYALSPLGYTVEEAYDAQTALDKYEEAMKQGVPFDIVIMDLTIPGGMGGKEAVVKLHELDPNAKAIVSSGYAMDPIMSRYRDYGFSGVIAKPYDINELEQTVSSLIA